MSRVVRASATIALAAVLGVSACTKPKKPAPAPTAPPPPVEQPRNLPPPPPPAPPAPAAPTADRPLSEDEVFSRKSLSDLNAEHPLDDAFFALDSAQLDDAAKPALTKNADWMKRWSSTKVLIEGHCDSRGTPEYNLALGERRAAAVRDYMVSLGVPVDRIQTVSKGKEQPFCADENEDCWHQNRRGHFMVTAK